MHNPYVIHSQQDVKDMLVSMELTNIEQLLEAIPEPIRLNRDLALPTPLEEGQLDGLVRQIARRNTTVLDKISFLGCGLYEHNVPAVVDYLSERGEFLTSYTPYQPLMSQGALEVLWEYQCKMQKLLGVNTVNASSYDGSTAFVDAFNMVHFMHEGRSNCRFQTSSTVWPQTQHILKSSLAGKAELLSSAVWGKDGKIDLDKLETQFTINPPDAFGFQCPNAFGIIEDIPSVVMICKKYNVTSIVYYNPLLSGMFTPPGKLGVDIVCGEGQMLGNHLNAGGATFGFLGCQQDFSDAIPGRIVGIKHDENNKPFYSLVREEREQHIARDKATSNICSNQANCVIKAAIYLSLQGTEGLKSIVNKNNEAACYFAGELNKIDGVDLRFDAPFFNEFIIDVKEDAQALLAWLRERDIYGGSQLQYTGMENCLLLAVTETKTRVQLDTALEAINDYFQNLPIPRIQFSSVTESYTVCHEGSESIGKLKQYFGHFSVLIRAWAYIRTLGAKGLKEASEYAILNANYIQHHLKDYFPAVFDKICMHECLLSADNINLSVLDISDVIMAHGFHPPTMVGAGCVWFPGDLSKAMLIEPTETESKQTLDGFINAMKAVHY